VKSVGKTEAMRAEIRRGRMPVLSSHADEDVKDEHIGTAAAGTSVEEGDFRGKESELNMKLC